MTASPTIRPTTEVGSFNVPPFRTTGSRRKFVPDVIINPQSPQPPRRYPITQISDIEPDDTLCTTCRNINAEKLRSKAGYFHLQVADLQRSLRSCHLCKLFWNLILPSPREHMYRLWLKGERIFFVKIEKPGVEMEKTRSCLLKYSTEEHDPAVELGVNWTRRLTNTRSDASFDTARSWLADCCANPGGHEKPNSANPQDQFMNMIAYELPRRLIDVQPLDGTLEQFSLKDTGIINFDSYPYCTLSYCWGGQSNPSWITTKANLQSRQVGFDRSELPPTLRDATFIAQKLGFRYIWIDAICIVQDDDDDWTQEGSNMASIYRSSHLTIAVALGYSCADGAFNEQSRSHLEDYLDIVRVDSALSSSGKPSTLYFIDEFTSRSGPYRYVSDGPLSTRAWCLQETLLSTRVLYYTPFQLIWECGHFIAQEDRLPNLPRQVDERMNLRNGGRTPNSRIIIWYRGLVPQYSKRKLARGSDKLVAISAIARALSLYSGAEYLAGLWRDCLMVGMLWYRDSPGKKTSTYRCPSWSWASQDSAIKYIDDFRWDDEDDDLDDAAITAAEVEVDHRNPFGAVTGGFLKLSSVLLCHGTVIQGDREKGHPEHKLINCRGLRPVRELLVWMDDDDLKLKDVICVYVDERNGLMLERADERKDLYRRMGFWCLSDSERWNAVEHLRYAPRRSFTII
ncbi:heterokaryon incompatibility protein-domain-containing protein [Xylaria arbuscula]|nr:heterokaryon incompatibility protein-domain-containing protein [Xylaria arbuscula]